MDDKGQCDISNVSLFDTEGIEAKPKIILPWRALGQEGITCILLIEKALKNSVEQRRASVWLGDLRMQ